MNKPVRRIRKTGQGIGFKLLLLAVVLVWVPGFSRASPLDVIYPDLNGNGKDQLGYRVLALALKEAGCECRLRLYDRPASPTAAPLLLEKGLISVWDTGTSPELEQAFLPVYFPIDQGLNGWRLFIIRAEDRAAFQAIKSAEQLRGKVAGQAVGAPDIKILEHAGITVNRGKSWPQLFPMLEAKRFDFIPLGANEVYGFLDKYGATAPSSIVDSNIVLIYPFGRLFFVSKQNTILHDMIDKGLRKAFEKGSFQQLFNAEPAFKAAMARARLADRVRIMIENPSMTEAFRKIPRKYFFSLHGRDRSSSANEAQFSRPALQKNALD